ncbi:MAG TPA: acyltransferase [Bryobacteraceae bacterium]|nr:acyltransferase [Bryobacteraceae bacterium]
MSASFDLREAETAVLTNSREDRRIKSLDGIRGIAVILVLAVHFENTAVLPETSALSRWVAHVTSWGWCGVDLFFVLSGFLITGILLDTSNIQKRFQSFYSRRVLRIFPLYYGVLLLCVAVSIFLPHTMLHKVVGPSTTGWVSYLLYLENWWLPGADLHHMEFLGPFWSLAIEEQFYLIWPLCVWQVSTKTLAKICSFGIFGAFLLRWCLMMRATTPLTDVVYMNTLTRMDGLLAGGFCAIAVRNAALSGRVRRSVPAVVAVVVVGLAIIILRGHVTWNDHEVLVYGHLCFVIGFACLVLSAYWFDGKGTLFDRAIRSSGLTTFGKYSYGIYVYQTFILELALHLFRHRAWWGHSMLYAVALAFGWTAVPFTMAFLSYHLFEKQFLRLRHSFAV